MLAVLFLLLGLPLGLVLVWRMPLGQVADEPAHVLKADSLLHGQWIAHREMMPTADGRMLPRQGVDADRALLEALTSPPRPLDTTPTRIDRAALERSRQARFGTVSFSETGTIGSYFPAFYLAAAGAIGGAQALGAGTRTAFLAARLANLLVALALGTAALLVARRGTPMLFAILLLPTSLGLMASVNQDGLLIACSVLAAALASRIDSLVPPWRQPCFLAVCLLVMLVCLAKPPYLPMAALLLLPLDRTRRLLPGWPAIRLAAIGGVFLAASAWTLATIRYGSAPAIGAIAEAGPLWPGSRPALFGGTDMAEQMRVLLADPLRLVWLPLHSMIIHPAIFRQMIDAMGWLNLLLPPWLVGLWAVSLCIALFGPAGRPFSGPRWPESLLLLLAAASTIVLIYLSQYLSFTPVGWDWISGAQGRYLLPLLPLLALAAPERTGTPILPALPAAAAALLGIWVVPACIHAFFHAGTS